jgi:hypothetical protein
MEYMYHIDKCDAVRSEHYGTWEVQKYEAVNYGLCPFIETIFRAKTRKECIAYANENELNVTFIGTGRIVRGHKW